MLQQDEIPMGIFVSDQLLKKLTNRVSTKSERDRETQRKKMEEKNASIKKNINKISTKNYQKVISLYYVCVFFVYRTIHILSLGSW